MRSKWTRNDVLDWWKSHYKTILSECGCEMEDHSVYGETMYQPDFEPLALHDAVLSMNGHDGALCPETYGKVADLVCQDPHGALQAIRPIMQQIGVGCPQSFAKALFDVFSVGEEMGIIKPFNTDS